MEHRGNGEKHLDLGQAGAETDVRTETERGVRPALRMFVALTILGAGS